MKQFALSFCLLAAVLQGVPASSQPITLIQPDETAFQAHIRGDEWNHWYETADGYTISRNDDLVWVYAVSVENNRLVLGSDPAHIPPVQRSVPKHLHSVRPAVQMPEPGVDLRDLQRTEFEVPLLLIDYPDMPASYPPENFEELMNSENYTTSHGPTGSFNNFYMENSYGQFDPFTTVYGWFTAQEPHDIYGSSAPNGWNMVRLMIRQAVDEAEAMGVDWTLYDNDGNGTVDALNVIHAGFGAEEGSGSNVWSHRWNLGDYAVEYDGVWIDDYTINPEKQGQNTTPEIVNIGVICHEFGHALGLPDLYDTDYSSTGIGTWGLMAGGSWGGNGNSAWYPAHFCAWSKVTLGWVDPIVITEGSLTLDIPNVEENPVIYRMDGEGPENEYWLFENRQQILSDQTLKNSGLMIWHVDDNLSNNNNEWHYLVDLEQADGNFDLNENRSSDMGDPYPGSYSNHEFADHTTPNSRYYSDEPSGVSVLNIEENDMIISANFRNLPTIYISEYQFEEFDGDGDLVPNPGETAGITAAFYNPSSDPIDNLTASVSSADPGITVLTETIAIEDLDPYQSGTGDAVLVAIDSEADLGIHSISFTVAGEMPEDLFDQVITLDFEVTVNQVGYPVLLDNKVNSAPLSFDLDQDGTQELIFGDFDGFLHVRRFDGSIFPGQWPFDTENQIWGAPAAADIDLDGTIEIVVNSKSRHLYILDTEGNVELDFDADQFLVGTPALGNLDDDADLEIVFGSMDSAGQLFALNPDGTSVDGFPYALNERCYEAVGLTDFNSNGLDDIVIGTDTGHLHVILDDGMEAEGFPLDLGDKIRSAPALADLDSDGRKDIIIGCDSGFLTAVDFDGNEIFSFDTGAAIRTSPAVIEDSGILKIFIGNDDGNLYGISPGGNAYYNWPQNLGQPLKSSAAFADLDSDGFLEIMVASKSGQLTAFRTDGEWMPGFPFEIGQSSECSPLAADLDGDGDLELAAGSDTGLSVIDWKLPGFESDWSMFHGNAHRNGCYEGQGIILESGDLNSDSDIDILDIVIMVAIIIGEMEPTDAQLILGDINWDGEINVQDAVVLAGMLLEV